MSRFSKSRQRARAGRRIAAWAVPLMAVPVAAAIADISAADLQAELRQWVQPLSGTVKPDTLTVQQSGNDYTITAELARATSPDTGKPATYTVKAHPLEAGRWSIDDYRTSSPLQIPMAGGKGTGYVHLQMDQQKLTGTIDPTLATASTISGTANEMTITADGPQPLTEHVGEVMVKATLAPRTDKLLDGDVSADLKGLRGGLTDPRSGRVEFSADHAGLAAHVAGLSPAQALPFLDSLAQIASAAQKASAPPAPPGDGTSGPPKDDTGKADATPKGADKTALRALIASLTGLASESRVEEIFDGMKVVAPDKSVVAIDHLKIGFGGHADGGVLTSFIDVTADAIQAPVPPNQQALVPRHLHLHPVVTGVGVKELLAALAQLTSDDPQVAGAAWGGLVQAGFSHGGLKMDLPDTELTAGGAVITAQGSVNWPAPVPMAANGEFTITATGFDDLVATLQKDPTAAQPVMMLGMARALARPNGGKLLWVVSYHQGTVLVNGQSLMPRNKDTIVPPGAAPGSQRPGKLPN
jgi:hypothetical protein